MRAPMDPPEAAAPRSAPLALLGRGLFYLFGVALPLATLGFELLTHGAAQVYFDPIPTWIHAGLVAFVPAAALWVDRSMRRGTGSRGACAAGGFALGIALFYAVLFLPILPLSVLAIFYMGLGLLSFAALGAAFALARRGRPLSRRVPGGTRWLWSFAGAGVLVLLLGPPGTGKSHIAQALRLAAIQQGHRVLYREAHTLIEELADATLDGTRKERMQELATVSLLIIDDLGMRKLPAAAVTALLDRLLHHAHLLKCGPKSWRTRQSALANHSASR